MFLATLFWVQGSFTRYIHTTETSFPFKEHSSLLASDISARNVGVSAYLERTGRS